MLEALKNTDASLFLYLNGMHCPACDAVMPYLTEFWMWIPLFAWWLWLLFKKYGKKVISVVLFLIVLIVVTDQGANVIKKSVKRYRPTHNLQIKDKVHVVNDYRGGEYGFVSNHAANVWGVAIFVFLLLRPVKKVIVFSFFAWALFICYTRIYLGVHYPLDLVGGALLGVVAGYLIAKMNRKVLV